MKRALGLLALSAWLLQGLFLASLHEAAEVHAQDDCSACVSTAPTGPSARPLHTHPIHDEGSCALCQSIQAPMEASSSGLSLGLPDGILSVPPQGDGWLASSSCRLPGSRAPPARTL